MVPVNLTLVLASQFATDSHYRGQVVQSALNDVASPVKDFAVDGYNAVASGQVFQSVLNDAKNAYDKLNNAVGGNLLDRGLGILQAGVGGFEVAGGGVVGGVLTSETGVGTVLGGGLALHGLDDIQAGVRQAATGKPTETFTQQGVTSLAQHAGAPPMVAAAAGTVVDIAAGGGVGSSEKAAVKGAEAFEIAKAGGKHAGFLKNYLGRSPAEIEKGIASLEKQIADHESWIANPESKIPNFKSLDPRQQAALINNKWPSDIQRQQEQLDILRRLRSGQ